MLRRDDARPVRMYAHVQPCVSQSVSPMSALSMN